MSERKDDEFPKPDSNGGNDHWRRKIHPGDQLPPKLDRPRCLMLWTARIFMLLAVCHLLYICIALLLGPTISTGCIFCTYITLSVFFVGLVTDRLLLHKKIVHEARTEDRSEIEALIQEAQNVQPPVPDNDQAKLNEYKILQKQVRRLTNDLGPAAWTDYQILTINQLLVNFLPIEDLKARALSNLVELEEYAEGDAFSYNARLYKKWEERINKDIEFIERPTKDEAQQSIPVDRLRADLRSLLEHIADYESNWAQGKTIVNAIRLCGSTAVVVFVLMGLLGLVYPVNQDVSGYLSGFSILHWGFLGSAGAITSVLLGLRNSDAVEVGNTEGFQELWRAVLGAILGFVAGILIFAALAGGLISNGGAVPNLIAAQPKDVYLSIIWAMVAGMGFESIFQRMRNAVGS